MIKKTISIVTILVVIALVLWGSSRFMKPQGAEVAVSPCAIDFNSTIMPDPQGKLSTDKEIAQAMFDHYFSFYVDRPQCLETSLKSAKLVSIGAIKHDVTNHFIADISFDLEPTSLSETKWITPEVSTTTDGWIRNKKGSLSIRVASSTYYLII